MVAQTGLYIVMGFALVGMATVSAAAAYGIRRLVLRVKRQHVAAKAV